MAQETTDGLPISDGFDFPVGPRGENVDVFKTHKVDTVLVDPGYFKSFGVWHTGEDWNGRGGGDTDLGDSIYAISAGRVVEFGDYPPSWGNLVLLEHALPDGSRAWSQYAHLDRILVNQVGQKVTRGQQIGTMGKGAKTEKYPQGRWIAHLHFEIRKNKLAIDNWTPMVRDRDAVLANYYSPTQYINTHRPGMLKEPAPSPQPGAAPPAEIPQPQPAPTPRPAQIIVDALQTNPNTGAFGRTQNAPWFMTAGGYQNNILWTLVSAQQETDYGVWHPKLPQAGAWKVWVYIPTEKATSTYARYKIIHANGQSEVPVNQWGNRGQWVNLGMYNFPQQGGFIRLGNFTGELNPQLSLGFDAICFTRA